MAHHLIEAVRKAFAPRRGASIETEAALEELRAERAKLQAAKNSLGGDVFQMIETGDALAALVHGARTAQFHTQIDGDQE